MKIAILGGSFNPVHSGHIIIAREVYKKIRPSKFFFVPTSSHPLKTDTLFLSYEKRCALLKKALKDYPEFEISYLDKTEKKPSYTYYLVKKFQKLFPKSEIFFVIGKDIIGELHLWYKYQWLLDNIKFVVITRNTDNPAEKPEFYNKLIFIKIKPIDISSTMIREKIKKGEPITNLVPKSIEKEVIKDYSLLLSSNN